MRVTSDFFVSAFVRQVFARGGFAAVPKKGAAEAGAVFVAVDRLDGTYDLYGPAPQAFFEEPVTGRLFERLLAGVDRATVFERLEREKRMDPDHWVIELDSQSGETGLEVVEAE